MCTNVPCKEPDQFSRSISTIDLLNFLLIRLSFITLQVASDKFLLSQMIFKKFLVLKKVSACDRLCGVL